MPKVKKITVAVPVEQPKTWYQKFWASFKNSGTILYARLISLFGFVIGAVGAMDWSPLWSFLKMGTLFTKQQLLAIGASVVGAGITAEIIRRRGTKEVNNNLIPKSS